jgi:nucleoside-diphosphate-sugar epimerase
LLPAEADNRRGDLSDFDAVLDSMQEVDVVVHMAALLHVLHASSSLDEAYERVNVGGTDHVVRAAEQAGAKRILFFSTIAVYGDDPGVLVTEETEPRPSSSYAKSKLAAETLVREARDEEGRALGSVLRLSAVYGPRVKGNYRRLLESLDDGRFRPVGRGENRRTLIHEIDVARFTLLAAQHPQAPGSVFNVTDGEYHSVAEIIEAMCAALGRKPPRAFIPERAGFLAAALGERLFGLVGRQAPVGRDSLAKYTADVAVSGELAQRVLGFKPRYDLVCGWNQTVEEMRRSGELH